MAKRGFIDAQNNLEIIHTVDGASLQNLDGQFFKDTCMQSKYAVVDFDAALDEALEENRERWGIDCAAGISPDGNYSAAIFTVQSGIYYWYWGQDKKGGICCLTADFFTYL